MPKLGEAKSHSFIGHNFGLIAPADGDQAAVAHAAASWSETQSRAVREAATRIAKLEDARASFREALAREINAEAARQLREFSQHQRLALRTLLRAGDFQKRRETARTTHEQSLRLMAEIGVNRERLRTLYAGFRGEAAGIVQRPAVASRLLTRAAVEAAPQPIRDRVKSWDFKASPATADGLTIFQPPFDGWWWKGSWYRAGGNDPQIDIYPDPATGSIGHRSEWGDGNASDFDAFTLDYDTSVSVWYKPPKSGVLDVWIIATCGSAHYDIWLDDEWGWSDSDFRGCLATSRQRLTGDRRRGPHADMASGHRRQSRQRQLHRRPVSAGQRADVPPDDVAGGGRRRVVDVARGNVRAPLHVSQRCEHASAHAQPLVRERDLRANPVMLRLCWGSFTSLPKGLVLMVAMPLTLAQAWL